MVPRTRQEIWRLSQLNAQRRLADIRTCVVCDDALPPMPRVLTDVCCRYHYAILLSVRRQFNTQR